MFPLEFHLVEVPKSLQATAASKTRWKADVQEAARQRLAALDELVWLESEPCAITIYYFPTAPMAGDIDNIVKPILDALAGFAYHDDQVIERVVSQKFEPETEWIFSGPSEQLSAALDAVYAEDGPSPVVYIRVDNDLSWRRL